MILASAAVVEAQAHSKKKQIERLAAKVADAYESYNLSSLDRLRLFRGNVKIVIEYSILDWADPSSKDEQFKVRRFQSFKSAERWLTSREGEGGTPFRESRPLAGCRKGRCTFDFNGGILHNHLYLQKIFYGYRKNRLFIKKVYLLNG